MTKPQIRTIFAATVAIAGVALCLPARASTFTVEPSTSGSTTTFTVTRSDTNAAETVRCRAVSRSALAGLHFMGNIGRLDFAAGERSKSVSVTEYTAAEINDPRFIYYQSGGATGSSRTYRFEVIDDGGFALAYADRAISYDASKSVSSATFEEKSVTVTNGEITVKDTGFAQAYHAVPLANYFSSTMPEDYLASSGANLRMLIDLQAAEVDDGYQYIQILINQTSNCDMPKKGSDNGDPGTVQISRYMAGFEHRHGVKVTNFKRYTFPVVSTNDNCGATLPWSDQGNDVGNLCMQRFNTNCRAADGRLVVPAQISSLGIRFTASGGDDDDWTAKSVVARIQAVPAGPSLLDVNPAVTPAPVCKGSVVSVSLPFNEIVTVSGTPTLSTTWGNLAYVAGSGANVLTFAGTVTAAAGTSLRLTGLSGTVKGLTGTSFNWSGTTTVSGRTVDTLPAPPREGLVYQLSTSAHLLWFADRLATVPNTSVVLAADIDLSNVSDFVPMGGANGFMGTFDGRGHVLSGLSVSSPDSASPAAPTVANPARYGLFGQIAAQGVVSNLVLSGATVSASLNPALVGAVCGRNLGTIALCSVLGGEVSTGPRSAVAPGTALGGICGENAGTVRACRVVAPLGSTGAVLYNRVKNDTVGGIAGTNAVSGTLESSYFHASFSNVENVNITRGAVCGSNAGTIRRCVGLHDNYNYFNGAVGSDAGTVEDTLFPDAPAFSGGEVCYALNGGVTDGSQPWYQALGTDALPVFSGSTVYFYGNFYSNEILDDWRLLQVQLDAGGTVTLTNDVTATDGDASLTITNAVTLDLNGHTLTHNGNRQALSVGSGGDLTLTNSLAAGTVTGGGDHGVYVGSNAVFRLQGGAIAGNESNYAGGGVFVDQFATFEMSGGSITNNAVTGGLNSGGGVYVVQNGTFTMAGGAISGNTADSGGGGVYVYDGGTFEMTGGAISGNTASNGGGVYVTGRFTVSGVSVVSGSTNSVGAANNVYLPKGKEIAVSNLTAGARIGVTTETTPTVSTSVMFATGVAGGEEAYFFSDKPAFAVDVANGELRLWKPPTPWDLLQAQLDAGGTVTLTNDMTATDGDATLTITNAVTLDLNGHTLDAAGRFGVIEVLSGGDLILTNGVPGSGAITGGTDYYGGGVLVYNGGRFTMAGGAISGNSATYGGGVYVYGTFTMTGGAISGNSAKFDGGGVYVRGGTFEMTGGAISGNTADAEGGGVYVFGGTFTVSGRPVVSGSTNSVGAANNVYLPSGRTITVNGLSSGARIGVTTETAPTASAPVTFATGASAGDDAYFFSDDPGFVVDCVDNALHLRPAASWEQLQAQLDAGGTVTLMNDVTAADGDASLTVTNAVTLDLKGHTIDAQGKFRVVDVSNGGNLTLTNSVPESGAITGGNASNGGGVHVARGGTFTLSGGAISGNTADYGGGVYVYSGGTFEMAGGEISGDTANRDGGGVYMTGGTFEMTGGAISGNTASYGGGVEVYGGTFKMTGGEISGNTADSGGGGVDVVGGTFEMTGGAISGNTADDGGGVYVYYNGTFEMTGGEISGNTADDGGGVYVYGTFTVSGVSVVSGSTNSVGAANNVYLPAARTIAVNGLSPGARIGVTTETAPTASAPVTFATGASAGDEEHFFSDVSGYHVERNGGTLQLAYGVGAIPYIDANGEPQVCTNYTVLTNAAGDVEYGGGSEKWYVVTNDVTISGNLYFDDDTAHLILCDGATLAVTNANGHAIEANGNLTIYGQTNGTGTVTANGDTGISAYNGSVTINGGTVTANGDHFGIFAEVGSVEINGGTVTAESGGEGIYAADSDIILGWTKPTDSITASSYRGRGVSVKSGQRLTDGSAIYMDYLDPFDIAGVTLRPPMPAISYLDEGGAERQRYLYTVLTNAAGDVRYGGGSGWYVVTTNVTISGQLYFRDNTSHLILCDGATLAVTNEGGRAIQAGNLAIYGQTNGTGTVTATGGNEGIIWANNDVTINGGTVTANGTNGNGIFAAVGSVTINGGTVTANGGTDGNGIRAQNGSIILGWTKPTDSITASSYGGRVHVKSGQRLTDGIAIYKDYLNDDQIAEIAGKTLRPHFVPYIDADGVERFCTDFTVLTNAAGNVAYGANGATAWYVVTNAVTISGQLFFGDYTAHLILCDGATLAVTNEGGIAIEAYVDLTIYGQTNGTGTVTANGSENGISANFGSVTINGGTVTANGRGHGGISANSGSVTINGGTVTAEGGTGIYADGSIILGWTNPTDSITASSYSAGGVSVKDDQQLTDGSNIYKDTDDLGPRPSALAGKTLRPAYSITLPEGVVASGVVMQIVNTAYARPGDIVTLSAAPGYYGIGNVTVDGVPLEPVAGVYSFAASAASITVTATVCIPVPYIDADGTERLCTDYTVITNAVGGVEYGELNAENWYVVTTNVNISGQLYFNDDTAHLILCDGATLAVTNENGNAITAYGLTIYGQTNGTGTVTASGTNGPGIFAGSVTINGGNVTANGDTDIYAHYSVTINGGTVTAEGGTGIFTVGGSVTINGGTVTANGTNGYGIYAGGSIILGWTNPTDSITASSYDAVGGVRVKSGQQLTDGSDIYMDYIDPALAGVTLRPYIDTPAYPAYLGLPADPADDTEADAVIRANYDAWALRYGYDALGAYEAAFLLNIAPWATPIELRIAGIEMAEGGARVRVTCRAGASAEAGAVDLSQINGVISVSAGDAPDALAPKAASGITYSAGEATIFVPASAGRFVKAVIGVAAPAEEE